MVPDFFWILPILDILDNLKLIPDLITLFKISVKNYKWRTGNSKVHFLLVSLGKAIGAWKFDDFIAHVFGYVMVLKFKKIGVFSKSQSLAYLKPSKFIKNEQYFVIL